MMNTESISTFAARLDKALREINENDVANRIDAILADIDIPEPIPKRCDTCKYWKKFTYTLGECHMPLLTSVMYTRNDFTCSEWIHGSYDEWTCDK